MTIEIGNFMLALYFRWGIGLDLESTGQPVPSILYDDLGNLEYAMYEGWTVR